ncbi:CCR4-NOT transcription complex subunit 3-like isoform X2 [Teleopsis dalmanni]|nr:CCR4-NOT transcription complex subunit 3-like isoform X2 [Teleopsis dalmanni]XP_037954484.1 CCR4-NOT transcription complex subunit 3-like isoform X2 [Teleopsis dalmanni]XP_037954485.1 CCR4-NOT transcription complex subunit 3-like isoform X2 [Teleopsis dalmanni]XP_037954486.1 CCR4-NOT transcription complex subunit 3-like isoform X2 [Teleopsis dalmanni]
MAASKKLLIEIERGMKKVAEGVEIFEEIWNKIHNSKNLNLKKKYENDLQKEIKKLQRLRDQIKVWLQLSEVKDKTELYNNKRLIETQMERFKIIERETKTKAYSKEGLDAAQKMDPCDRIKDDIRNWLTNAIYSLQIQIDLFESEIESLKSCPTSKKNKRLDNEKQERLDRSTFRLSRHNWHVERLETILRLLDNDTIGYEPIHKIRDDVQYYIDSSQEPEFAENTYLYEDILSTFENSDSPRSTSSSTGSSSIVITYNDPGCNGADASSSKERQNKIKTEPLESIAEIPRPTTLSKSNPLRSHKTKDVLDAGISAASRAKTITPFDNNIFDIDNKLDSLTPNTSERSYKYEGWNPEVTLSKIINNDDIPSTSKQALQSLREFYAPANLDIKDQRPTIAEVVASGCATNWYTSTVSRSTPNLVVDNPDSEAEANLELKPVSVSSNLSTAELLTREGETVFLNSSNTNVKSIPVFESVNSVVLPNSPHKKEINSSTSRRSKIILVDTSFKRKAAEPKYTSMNVCSGTTYASVASQKPSNMRNTSKPPLLNYNSPQFKNITLKKTAADVKVSKTDMKTEQKMLSTKNSKIQPLPSEVKLEMKENANDVDSDEEYFVTDRKTQVGPSVLGDRILKINDPVIPAGTQGYDDITKWQLELMNSSYNEFVKFDGFNSPPPEKADYIPYVAPTTPKQYPGNCFQFWNTTQFYDSLEINSLFFIFYYTNGSMSNYLASKALKKLRWRFHQGERVWLKRRSDPVLITSDYERGDYVQFDFDKWIEESRDNFIFEYKYLEEKF